MPTSRRPSGTSADRRSRPNAIGQPAQETHRRGRLGRGYALSDGNDNEQLSLYDAARAMGVTFASEAGSAGPLRRRPRTPLSLPGMGRGGVAPHGAPARIRPKRVTRGTSWPCPSATASESSPWTRGAMATATGRPTATTRRRRTSRTCTPSSRSWACGRSAHRLSMGGRNAFTYASSHPERVRALVIVDAAPESRTAGTENIRRFVQQKTSSTPSTTS